MDEQMKTPQSPRRPIDSLMTTTLAKLKEMVDVDVIVGKPIETPDGTTLIPVSRLSMGFGSGGSDFAGKNHKDNTPFNFGGGSGAGVEGGPVGLPRGQGRLGAPAAHRHSRRLSRRRAVEMVPQLVDKIIDYLDRQKDSSAL